MNYRHDFHAGNFADVMKHALVTLIVEYLKKKEKPFRVIDTHAGAGLYDLEGEEALRTGEHRAGISRVMAATTAKDDGALSTYLDVVRALNEGGSLRRYPGSPLLVRRLLRRQDRLSAYELHPADTARLAALFNGDYQVKTFQLDGWLALGAHLPPKERRGLVLVDPPFEKPDEFGQMIEALKRAYRRWPGGIYALWYPIKRIAERDAFLNELAASGFSDVIAAELEISGPENEGILHGSGLSVVNPPYTFAAEADSVLKRLERILAGPGGRSRLVTLASE